MPENNPSATQDTNGQSTPPADNNSNVTANWYDALPEDLVGNPNITKYTSMEELARGHISATTMLGKDKIAIPTSDEEFRDTYFKLGLPQNASEYTIEEKDYGIPAELYAPEVRTNDLEKFKNAFHEAGLNNKQSQFLYDKFMEHQGESVKNINRNVQLEMAKVSDQMLEQWGEAKATNLEIANRALAKYFGDEVALAVEASGLGRNFNFINGMYKLGASSLEELGLDKRGFSAKTPEQYADEIKSLQAHPAYFDSKHPEHQTVNARVLAIYERMEQNKSGL